MMLRVALAAILIGGCAVHTPAAWPETEPAPSAWRVVSYNIRHGRGMDDRVDVERTASVLRRLDPDIVALQEVDVGVARSGSVNQPERLGELLGMYHAFGSFMEYRGGRYGMAILARCPVRSIEPVRLTEGNEPRVALAVEIEQPDGGALTVVNVHFDWVADDAFRFTQAGEVARFLDELPGPYILAGDFNDVPGSRTLNLFRQRAREAVKPRDRRLTFSSTDPRREIDFIFVSAADEWIIDHVEVADEPIASDHLPVIAVLELPPQRNAAASLRRIVRCQGMARAP